MRFSEAQLTFGPDGLGGRVVLLEADYSLVLYSAERKSVSSAAKKNIDDKNIKRLSSPIKLFVV